MKKDKYGEILTSATDDVCCKCGYNKNAPFSKECNHCDTNLHYNEYYKPEKVVKTKVKLKSNNKLSLNTRVYLKESEGWTLVRKYKAWFGLGKYVAIMKKSN